MKKWLRCFAGVVAAAGLLSVAAAARAESCKLEIKKVGVSSRVNTQQDYIFRATYPQSFFMQIGSPRGVVRQSGDKDEPEFSKIVKKEPAKYTSQHPFRGVAKLGSQYFGFVIDTAPTKEKVKKKETKKKSEDEKKETGKTKAKSKTKAGDAKSKTPAEKKKEEKKPEVYSKLYFDLNHNGDLTDDKMIAAEISRNYGKNYSYSMFPRADLTIDIDGTRVDYAFTMRVNANSYSSFSYVNASLNAAAYREGQITLGGKKYRVVVMDFNSNGRFNDVSNINKSIRTHDGTVHPTQGDRVYLIDPEKKLSISNPYDVSSSYAVHYLGKLINIGGKYHDLTIPPVGDNLTITPSSIPVGYVTNPNRGYRAIVYGDGGLLKVAGDESGKAPLPEGEWKLLSYTIDHDPKAEKPKAEKPKKEEPKAEKSKADTKGKDKPEAKNRGIFNIIKDAVANTISPSGSSPAPANMVPVRSRISTVSARAKGDYKAVKVVKDKTAALPFGPPYRPIVKAQYPQGNRKISLDMSLVGMADEICNNLTVNGGQPGKPHFTISTKEGKEVASGNFEYG